jgi:hypothetical protein
MANPPVLAESTDSKVAAVKGENMAKTGSGGFGVWGKCDTGHGVHGESTPSRGVVGTSNAFHGVYGHSASNVGVAGESDSMIGVLGVCKGAGGAGVKGENTAAGGFGVWGFCATGTGEHRLVARCNHKRQ